MKIKISFLLLMAIGISFLSCQDEFLKSKPNKSLMVPSELEDFQALLDNYNVMNLVPALNIISSDDYYMENSNAFYLQIVTPGERNSYFWNEEIWEGQRGFDWDIPYQQIFYANVVLDGLRDMSVDTSEQHIYNNIKGSALFFRAFALYNIAQLFAPPYNDGVYESNLGVPIRLTANVNEKVTRSSIEETYQRIIQDLDEAVSLLSNQSEFKNRPSKGAAFAMLARTYLAMNNYDDALYYSELSLSLNPQLINYADLDDNEVYPFPEILPNGNLEVLFSYWPINYALFNFGIIKVDPSVYNAYSLGDLRKKLFFYENGSQGVFFTGYMGLCTNELYLIKAECLARRGEIREALETLNYLLEKRGSSVYTANENTTVKETTEIILHERRKELIGRDLRWTDLRRLNQHQDTQTKLERSWGDERYILSPNDNRYVLPLPDEEINNSDIQQNHR